MLIYRLAMDHPDKGVTGPYHYWEWSDSGMPDIIDKMQWAHSDRKHPTPYTDSGYRLIMSAELVCAFPDEYALMQWFDGFMDELHSLGFQVYIYEVPELEVMQFPYQCVASREAMTYVRHYALSA